MVPGYCAIPFAVRSESAGRSGQERHPLEGFCSAYVRADDRAWHEYVATEEGHWSIDFVGEKYTLGGSTGGGVYARQYSTRFFETDVLDVNGRSVEGGRASALEWKLTSHERS